jgi:hypothetical protein
MGLITLVGSLVSTGQAYQVVKYVRDRKETENRSESNASDTVWYDAIEAQWSFWSLNFGLWTLYNLHLPSYTGIENLQKWNPMAGLAVLVFQANVITENDSNMELLEAMTGFHITTLFGMYNMKSEFLRFVDFDQ